MPIGISLPMMYMLGFIGLLNITFSVFLFQWKKWAFWGFALTSLMTLVVNLNAGLGIAQSIFGLIGVAVLYAILQIKRDGATAWSHLE
jgi:hypothetical protein